VHKSRHTFAGSAVRVRRTEGESHRMQPIGAPFKRPNYAVCVTGGEVTLPTVHPSSVQSRHFRRIFSLTKKKPHAGRWTSMGRGTVAQRRQRTESPKPLKEPAPADATSGPRLSY